MREGQREGDKKMKEKAGECVLLSSRLSDWVQWISKPWDALVCHNLFLTIRSCFSHMGHMIDEGGVVQGEKKVRLTEVRLTVMKGLCLCNYGKAKKCEGCLSELHFFWVLLFSSANKCICDFLREQIIDRNCKPNNIYFTALLTNLEFNLHSLQKNSLKIDIIAF